MIAVDTSAIVAIVRDETDARTFLRLIVMRGAVIGTPTLLEIHMVLASRLSGGEGNFLQDIMAGGAVQAADFTPPMLVAATAAFDRYGRGRHAAGLNFGDCMAYAVAKTRGIPLLYKGTDFAQTDIEPAWTP